MNPVIRKLIDPRTRDLGDLSVRRVLPAAGQQMVGSFVFFDHMGPADFAPGTGIDVRPHPHIGIATVTYLFEGTLLHRDSLGVVQEIEPGAVNWMTAGRGIVHSERTGPALRASGHRIHGIQSWVALPRDAEETEPAFRHYPAAQLPGFTVGDASLRIVAGTAFGRASPVEVRAPTLYVDVRLPAGGSLTLPAEHAERALYVAEGRATLDDAPVGTGQMAVLEPGAAPRLFALEDVRAMLLGGAPADGPRHIWWNFVSSSRERIELARRDWAEGRFPAVPGESEFIPLPER
ncbi:MAG: pirin family protein [Proteobacteria bacterium]|nr:pirin family protein [Pseudomonadota bacterium]